MGSSALAKDRMAELFDFAAKTPFEVGQIVSAETTLRGFGAAAEELMPGLIDFSATLGTDLAQSAIDFGKAWNQGAVGLESDTGRVLRKQIELRAGVDATSLSLADFRTAMLETLDEGMFAGGADRLSQTFGGMISNLTDEWGRFKMEVADAGLFNNMKGVLAATLGYIADHREQVQKLAELVSGGLWNAFKAVAYTIAGIVDIGQAMEVQFTAIYGILRKLAGDTGEDLARLVIDMGAVAKAAGMDGLAGELDTLGGKMLYTAFGQQKLGQDGLKLAGEMLSVGSAVGALNDIFTESEKLAAGFGSEVAGIKGPGGAGGTGGGTGEDDAARAAALAAAARMEAALAFTDSLRVMGRTELQDEQAKYAESMGQLLAFNEEKLITGALFNESRMAIEQDYLDAVDAMNEVQAQKDLERRQLYASTVIGGVSSLLGTIGGLFDQSNEKQKAASKAFAVAQIAISTAVGVQKALADFGYPAGLVPAALVTASGVAQAAAVLQAHQGRAGETTYAHQGRGPAPDERDLRTLRTESMLNSQTTRALGPQGIEALNSGRSPSTTVNLQIGRVAQREIIREELRTSGSQLTRYVGGVVGSGDRVAGFSGDRAVA